MTITNFDKVVFDFLTLYAGCTVVHRYENVQRINLPYLTWFVQSIQTIGDDFTDKKTDNSGNYKIYSNKNATVYLQAFGDTSEDILNNIIITKHNINAQTYLLGKNTCFVTSTDINVLPEIIGNKYEKRSTCEITMKYTDVKTINVGYIDDIQITLNTKIDKNTTVHSDLITIGEI
jgi:hypothetical protein